MYGTIQLFIDGEWINSAGRASEDIINPATGKALGRVPHATPDDLQRAIEAAKAGFKVWSAVAPYDRSKVLRKAAELMRERADLIARVITLEEGKVFAEALGETLTSADIIDWMAEEGRRAYGRIIPGRIEDSRLMVSQEPLGVVAAFTPWNFPVLTPIRKFVAALAAGCSVVIKASEETPAGCMESVRCFADAGLPKGVINLVFGVPSEVSEYLIGDDSVRKVSFTGSVAVGKQLAGLAAKGMKRVTMELGGHAPVIVFDDFDPEKSAEMIAAAKYRNAGQVCISPTRFYVQEKIYSRFVKRFAEVASQIRLGDGLAANVTMGPLANARRVEAMEHIVADACKRGGRILTGGKRQGNEGFFFQPTVLTELPDDAILMTEEPFGPVAPIVPFKTFDEVVERANSLPFGLAAYGFSSSSQTATRLGNAIHSGMIAINGVTISMPETPFGGIRDSGYGYEGGLEGLEAYTVKKMIAQY